METKSDKVMLFRYDRVCKRYKIKSADVAKKLNLTTEALRMSLRGNPTIGRLTEVANAIGCPVMELIGADEPVHRINGYVEIDDVVYTVRTLRDILELVMKLQSPK